MPLRLMLKRGNVSLSRSRSVHFNLDGRLLLPTLILSPCLMAKGTGNAEWRGAGVVIPASPLGTEGGLYVNLFSSSMSGNNSLIMEAKRCCCSSVAGGQFDSCSSSMIFIRWRNSSSSSFVSWLASISDFLF